MEKYRDMTYTIRKNGTLMKKIEYEGTPYYIYSTNKEELYNKFIDLKYKLQNDKVVSKGNVLFKTYASKWFELNISTKEQATQNSVKNRIKHMNKYIGNMLLKSIKPNDIQNIITSMQKDGLTEITNRTLMDCKRIFDSAVINDLIEKNPCLGIKKIKYQKNERLPLTMDQDKKVLSTALNHKYGSFILIIRYCGLRPEEAVSLKISDVDLENKSIHIHQAASLVNNQPIIKSTKNLKIRDVPIPDIIFDSLKKQVQNQIEIGSDFVFGKETNKKSMWTKQALKAHLNTFLNELNRDLNEDEEEIKFSYYILRHSYCTMLYYSGIDIKEAQRLMGHSSAKMVYDIYTHLDLERENSQEKINTYISNLVQRLVQRII